MGYIRQEDDKVWIKNLNAMILISIGKYSNHVHVIFCKCTVIAA